MQRLMLILFLLGNLLPALAAKQVTVEQLEAIVSATHGMSDAKVASRISALELTERLSASRSSRIETGLPGAKSQQALVALADSAEFLNLPPAEELALAPPSAATRASLVALTIHYLSETIPKIPNFLATRITSSFEDTPAEDETLNAPAVFYRPLHLVGVSGVKVVNRKGQEQADSEAENEKQPAATPAGLTTSGEFGSVLISLGADVFEGETPWKRWEADASGPVAVFYYTVPIQRSHFLVQVPEEGKPRPSAYHGEIAVDPANGAVLRVTMIADLRPGDSVSEAKMLVAYGPVEIAGMTYILAARSVALSTIRVVQHITDHAGGFRTYLGPAQIQLNDVHFTNYRLFRTEVHILTGDNPEGDPSGGAPTSSTPH
jgi:hypothetical protein